jgi:hypothetical protein
VVLVLVVWQWQYRLLLGIIITLSVSLALLLTASLLYGFGMVYPRIQVTDLQVTQVSSHTRHSQVFSLLRHRGWVGSCHRA